MAANARTATKKAQARKTAKPAPVAGDFEPVRLTSKSDTPEERVVLFYVDDEPYDIPKKIGREYGLRYLDDVATSGEAVAAVQLMKGVLGDDGYEALLDCDGLDDESLDKIMDRIRDQALGVIEDPKRGRGKGR